MKLQWLRVILAAAASGLLAGPVCGQSAPSDREVAALGFSVPRLHQIDAFYAAKVAKGDMSGVVILIARHGKLAYLDAVGYADLEKKMPMSRNTLFRAYSMTKPLAATALMLLYEDGCFQLDDPISKYIPEFAQIRVLSDPTAPLDATVPALREPTIHDLLRHTAGLSHGGLPNAVDAEYLKQNMFGLDVTVADMAAKLARIPLLYQPGAVFHYSIAPDIEARLVELFSGMPFDRFLQQRLFAPLGMKDTAFWVGPDRAQRLATVYWNKAGRLTALDEVHGHPEDPSFSFVEQPWSVNSYTTDHPRKGGSFGLVTTAEDYWHFAQMMLDRGSVGAQRLLSPQVVEFMTRDHLDAKQREGMGKGVGFGLGFAVVLDPAAAGFMNSPGSYFWDGVANTHFWVDPKEDLVVVALTQDMSNPRDVAFEQEIRSLVYSAMTQ